MRNSTGIDRFGIRATEECKRVCSKVDLNGSRRCTSSSTCMNIGDMFCNFEFGYGAGLCLQCPPLRNELGCELFLMGNEAAIKECKMTCLSNSTLQQPGNSTFNPDLFPFGLPNFAFNSTEVQCSDSTVCSPGQMCNMDFGSSGFCEDCGGNKTESDCENEGYITTQGVAQCKMFCAQQIFD